MSNTTLKDVNPLAGPMNVVGWAATDVGKRRETNEDRYLCDVENGVFAVADGIGGKPGGEKASQTVVDELEARAGEFRQFLEARSAPLTAEDREEIFDFLFDALQSINREVYRRGTPSKFPRGIGSTLDMLVTAPEGAFILHVGDSRVYLMRDDEIFRVTRDHTFEQFLRRQRRTGDQGENPKRYAHVLTRSLGSEPRVEADRMYVDLKPGDRLLLCSDGVTRGLAGQELLEVCDGYEDQQIPDRLVDCANERGGRDNATAVFVGFKRDPERDFSEIPTRRDTFRRVRFLESVDLFEGLDFQELITVLGYVQNRCYEAGELVIARGDAVDGLYFVMEGRLVVEVEDREVTTLETGDHFGEFGLFGEPNRSADVRCQQDCEVLFMPQENLEQLVDETPDLGTTLLWRLLSRTSEIIQKMLAEKF